MYSLSRMIHWDWKCQQKQSNYSSPICTVILSPDVLDSFVLKEDVLVTSFGYPNIIVIEDYLEVKICIASVVMPHAVPLDYKSCIVLIIIVIDLGIIVHVQPVPEGCNHPDTATHSAVERPVL